MKTNLSNCQLFNGIEENEIKSLLQCLNAVEKTYKKGDIIFAEGEPTELIGVVLSGMAIIEFADVWGNNNIIGSAEEGDVFAEAYACIQDEPLLISVSAAEDTKILFMNIGRVLSSCSNSCVFHTKLVRNLLTVSAYKNLQISRRILHTSSKSIRGRLLSYFSECVKKSGSYSFEIPYNRQQLADYLSVDRSAMSNELSKMQKDGILKYDKNYFEINKSIHSSDNSTI